MTDRVGERAGGRPRVAGLSALLADISTLRTTLQADLSLVAAALDEGAEQVAGELIADDVLAVRNFEARAFAALEAMDGETRIRRSRRRGRAGAARHRLVPTAPLLVAAAALIGFAVGGVPERPEPAPVMSSAAGASYELTRLAVAGASTARLRNAAEHLNDEVSAVVAASGGSPAATAEALLLLERGSEVLLDQGDSQQMQGVLSETRQLADRLRSTLPAGLQQSFPRRDGRLATTLPGRIQGPAPITPFPLPTSVPSTLPAVPTLPLLAPPPGMTGLR